jgi:hypothetical protein
MTQDAQVMPEIVNSVVWAGTAGEEEEAAVDCMGRIVFLPTMERSRSQHNNRFDHRATARQGLTFPLWESS